MSATYFNNVDILFLCYSLDDSQSLEDVPFWNDLFEQTKTPENHNTLKYLIALKADNIHDDLESNRSKGKAMASEQGFKYLESISTNSNQNNTQSLFDTVYEDFRK